VGEHPVRGCGEGVQIKKERASICRKRKYMGKCRKNKGKWYGISLRRLVHKRGGGGFNFTYSYTHGTANMYRQYHIADPKLFVPDPSSREIFRSAFKTKKYF
jgi:hypothetical protein